MQDVGEQRAECSTHEQGRRQDAAVGARSHRGRGTDQLGDQRQGQQLEGQLVVEHIVDHAVAVAPDLGHPDRDHADDQSADGERDRQRPMQAAE